MSRSGAAPRLAAVALFILLGWVAMTAQADPPERIEGYEAYRFGMSYTEADALYADDTPGTQRNDSFAQKYLSRATQALGEAAEVLVLFDKLTGRLAAITLRFNRYAAATPAGECLRMLRYVEEQFTREFGTRNMIVATEPGGRNWHFPQGGVVSITNLCVGADKGAVAVSFRP